MSRPMFRFRHTAQIPDDVVLSIAVNMMNYVARRNGAMIKLPNQSVLIVIESNAIFIPDDHDVMVTSTHISLPSEPSRLRHVSGIYF